MSEWVTLSGGVKLKGEMLGVSNEVLVARKDRPLASSGHGANQEINAGASNPRGAAAIAGPTGFLIILSSQRHVVEGAQILSQTLELGIITKSRKKFLANGPDEQSAVFPDEFRQFVTKCLFRRAQALGRSTQSERPD
jgi:hypothetical protein